MDKREKRDSNKETAFYESDTFKDFCNALDMIHAIKKFNQKEKQP